MNPSQIPEKSLTVSVNPKLDNPQLTYFFEREDGTTFSTSGSDAWNIYSGKRQIIGRERPRYKFIGRSNGQKYNTAAKEAQEIFKTSGLAAAQEHLRKGLVLELEEARKSKIPPPNYDKIDNRGNPTNIAI